jgi:6-pyruvoyltetrahydropterin/6-carboxytetrahydropterin synthase
VKTKIGKRFVFEAAHQLNGEIYGRCSNLHGHRYEITIEIEGEINQYGWICDFAELEEMMKEVIFRFDHHNLNDYFRTPTVENIAKEIFETLDKKLALKPYRLSRVLLYETSDSYAEVAR